MRIKFTIFFYTALIALLTTVTLSAQSRIYTREELQPLFDSADTVIYRYPTKPPYIEALVFENRTSEIDFEDEILPRLPLFAVKTNLLYDAVTAINIEAEIPIGDRYSLSVEWIFPWWLSDSRQRCFELLCGNIKGRYWFGDRSQMELLTGWAAGFYMGGGYYDLEWDSKGYQGEYILSGGLTGSYAHLICENLRLEYSIGVGYISTKYRKYSAERCDNRWLLVRQSYGRSGWFGPTQVAISLSYMLHRTDKRGGVR